MFGLFKRRTLPAARRPALATGERVLAWAPSGESDTVESTVVATNLGLWWQGERLGWHQIAKATWDGSTMAIIEAHTVAQRAGYDVIVDQPPRRLRLADPDHVPNQVRQRVTGSVSYPRHHPLQGTPGGVWVAGRRVPGVDGLTWIVRYDEGVDPDDPAVVAITDQLVAAARSDATPSD